MLIFFIYIRIRIECACIPFYKAAWLIAEELLLDCRFLGD